MIRMPKKHNPYQSSSVSDDGFERFPVIRSLLYGVTVGIAVFTLAFCCNLVWHTAIFGKPVIWHRLIWDGIGLALGIANVSAGATFLHCPPIRISLVRATGVSALLFLTSGGLCAVVMTVFCLHPQTYSDLNGVVFRPVFTNISFVLFVFAGHTLYSRDGSVVNEKQAEESSIDES